MTARSRLLLLFVALALGCHRAKPPEESDEAASTEPIAVQVTKVERGSISETLGVTGETVALVDLRLASPIAGRVTSLSVRPGDRLAAGETAARVLSLENEAALHGLELLKGAPPVIPDEQRRGEILGGRLKAGEIPLRAPFPAVVAERLHNPGEQVAQGDVLLALFDPRSLFVLAQVPADSAGRVRAGMPAEIDGGGFKSEGKVEALVPAAGATSLTVPVRVSLATQPNPPLLHAAVKCRIRVADHTGALLIPRRALISAATESAGEVMVAANDRAERRKIKVGLRSADVVEVLEGLAEGDAVISEGQYALPEGSPIRIEKPPSAEESPPAGEGE